MELRVILSVCIVILFSSCASKKKVVTTTPKRTPKVILIEEPIEPGLTEIEQLKQIKIKPARVTPRNTKEYVKKFAPIAMREMQLYKIPASITLAQGILESGSGRSPLAIRSNNHFGIKCHRGWKGKSVTHDDDEIGECFRKYKYPETSYEDHSKFLTSRKRYSRLFRLKITDYRGWAYGLKRAGYATDPRYPNKLISLIKKFNLARYDKEAFATHKPEPKLAPVQKQLSTNYYQVRKGDTLYSIAKRHNITVKNLKKLNNLTNNTISIGQQLIVY